LATAQHDMGGGGATSGAAASSGESTSRSPVKRAATRSTNVARRTRAPVRRGITAEQYNKQGDDYFEAKEYDDALEAYTKAVQLKPIASAYYHIGWINNDRENYDQAIAALQQAVRLNPNDAVAFAELGYSYRNLKRYPEALDAYHRALAVKRDYAT